MKTRRRVEIRMTTKQEKAWRKLAKQSSMTLPEFIRACMRRVVDA